MLFHFHGAIESDLHDKGLDLVDLWRGKLSLRKVKVITDHLGPTSALQRAITDSSWTDIEELLATLIDVEKLALWQRAGDKNARRPEPYPRPGMEQAKEANLRAKAEAFRRTQMKGQG